MIETVPQGAWLSPEDYGSSHSVSFSLIQTTIPRSTTSCKIKHSIRENEKEIKEARMFGSAAVSTLTSRHRNVPPRKTN